MAKSSLNPYYEEYVQAYKERVFDVDKNDLDIRSTSLDIHPTYSFVSNIGPNDDHSLLYLGLRNIAQTNLTLGLDKGYPRLFVSYSEGTDPVLAPAFCELLDYDVIVIVSSGMAYLYTRDSIKFSNLYEVTYTCNTFGPHRLGSSVVLNICFSHSISYPEEPAKLKIRVTLKEGSNQPELALFGMARFLLAVDSISRGKSPQCATALVEIDKVFTNPNPQAMFFLFAFATQSFLFTSLPSTSCKRLPCLPNPKAVAQLISNK